MEVTTTEVLDTHPASRINSQPGSFKSVLTWMITNYSIGDFFRRTFHAFIGSVKEIDTNRSRVLVAIPKLNREFWATYPPNLEKFLSDHLRNLVEFEGKIKLDKNEVPYRAKSIKTARLADDSNVSISEVLPSNLRVKNLPVEFFEVYLSDDKQTYFAEYEEINFSCSAHTRSDLKEAIEAYIELDWIGYAMAPDESLNRGAKAFREKLHSMFEEI